jgi:ATP-dependent Clp protease ATP-binding subunit ClpA
MTSNLGAQHIEKMERLGFAKPAVSAAGAGGVASVDRDNYSAAKDKILASLKDYFRPEFLNRLDDIIIFDILSPEAVRKIVEIQVAEVAKRLSDKGIELVLLPEAYDFLAKEGYNPQYGARPLKRLIQNKILTPVAKQIIGQELNKGGTITVGVKESVFTFEVKKRRGKQESPIVMPVSAGRPEAVTQK